MKNNRLTTINQYGDILYCGPRNTNNYRNMGLYAENLDKQQIELILLRLWRFEEIYEDMKIMIDKQIEQLQQIQRTYNESNSNK